jgi:hypothetical protein
VSDGRQWASNVSVFVTLESVTCYLCGVAFGMPSGLRAKRLEDSKTFYCPNGHGQHYTETEATRLRRQLELKTNEADRQRERAERKERQLIAAKGRITRAKNRVAAGVCPVNECHRHFNNLGRHMATKHPDFKARELGS